MTFLLLHSTSNSNQTTLVYHSLFNLLASSTFQHINKMDYKTTESAGKPLKMKVKFVEDEKVHVAKPSSEAMSLPLYFTNAVFFALFFSVVYFLLTSWREKIRTNTPLHLINLSEIVAILAFVASFIYLLDFFGIDFVTSIFLQPSNDIWDAAEDDQDDFNLNKIMSSKLAPKVEKAIMVESSTMSEEDEEIIKAVVAGTISSYSLESKLGDCKRAASIRREALQRVTGKSLEGLPLEGFDYESILGQGCEMPIGYIST